MGIRAGGARRRAFTIALAGAITGAIAGVALATGATAQTVEERVGGHRDWSVYEHGAGDGRVCWVATTPKRSTARRGGTDVTNSVRRGEIYLNVAVRPGQNVRNEVSFIAGYPLRANDVRLSIGGDSFALLADGETAWTQDPAADDRTVAAMKAGVEAQVVGVSTRGTRTTDTFSLLGFTAALEDAQKLCGG